MWLRGGRGVGASGAATAQVLLRMVGTSGLTSDDAERASLSVAAWSQGCWD